MQSQKNSIEHSGNIQSIDNNYIYVKIKSHSACAACHIKGVCNASEMEEKIIEVKHASAYKYKTGDEVIVVLDESLGYTALILGYLLPFLILMLVLITLMSLFENELLAGLVSLVILFPYYLILLLNKKRLRKKFEFRIK